jgi:transposase
MTLHQSYLGVDVAKDWIDVFDPASNTARRIAMAARALKAFSAGLSGAVVVFEASGGYERPLVDALEAAGCAYVRVNPRQAREFARATGRLAKTDQVDARVLADMGRALELKPTPVVDPARRRLAELVARREDLVAAITAETNRLALARDAFVRRDIARLLNVLKARRLRLETEIAAHVSASEALDRQSRRLRSAPGIGPVLAAVLLAGLPELGACDRRAIASLAGLAPHASDSGHSHGRRCIWGGRSQVRRALYVAAFIASRCDPELKAMRKRLQDAGKPFKVAIIAVARKLLTILNDMIRNARDFQPRSPA